MVSSRYEHIDEILGDGKSRFFANGYKRVEATLDDVSLFADGIMGLKATLSVIYPTDWSKKQQSIDLPPHLSSIDAFVIAVRLNEIYLTAYFGLNEEMQSRAWVKAFSIRTLGRPQVSLECLPVSLRHVTTALDAGTVCRHVTTTRCILGALEVECEIEHNAQALRFDAQGRLDMAVANYGGNAYFACGYKRYERHIESVLLDFIRKQATAIARVDDTGSSEMASLVGLQSAYRPSLTFVDAILIGAQLAQAILYKVDQLDRAETNNLWMRRISASCRTPFLPTNAFIAAIHICDTRTLKRGDSVWRVADIEAAIQGIHGVYSVAHELPPQRALDPPSQATAVPGI